MRTLWLALLISCSSGLAFSQIDTDTFTVTASRLVNPQPDQIVFSIDVQSGLDSRLDQILSALASSDVTSANFSSVFFRLPGRLGWEFKLPTALSRMRETIAALSALQQTLMKGHDGLSLTFNVQGTQVSQELQAAVCSDAAMITDAQTQAQAMANAAGFSVGPILSISKVANFPSASIAIQGVAAPAPSPISGIFTFAPVLSLLTVPRVPPVTCSATIKFRLYRFH
jgi:uncharacterized protein YggE